MVECLTLDKGAACLTGVTVLWSLSKNIIPSLELVLHRKSRPFITERLLMGLKESNTNKQALLRQNQSSEEKNNIFLEIITCNPSMDHLDFTILTF